jgi:hypothetical protein
MQLLEVGSAMIQLPEEVSRTQPRADPCITIDLYTPFKVTKSRHSLAKAIIGRNK